MHAPKLIPIIFPFMLGMCLQIPLNGIFHGCMCLYVVPALDLGIFLVGIWRLIPVRQHLCNLNFCFSNYCFILVYIDLYTRALRRGHSFSQHTQFLKNNMIAENDFLWNFARVLRFALKKSFEKKVCLNRLKMLWNT